MKPRGVLALGMAAVLATVLAENLFGRQLNAFFLQYPGIDKGLHVIEYATVFVVLHWLLGRVGFEARRRVPLALVLGIALSVIDESVQTLAPGRSVELFDLVADWAGLSLAWVAVRRPSRRIALAVTTAALAASIYVARDTYVRLIDYSRALHYEGRHEFATARVFYLRAIASGHDSAAAYNGLAWVSAESGVADPSEAVEYGGRALAKDPDNPDVLDTYGWALHRAGRHDDALPYLLRAQQLKPELYCIHYHLGSLYVALGRPDEARQHLQQQVRLEGTREAALAKQLLDTLSERPHAQSHVRGH